MLPTPSTSHVDPNRIYDPAEDSYLLLDTLSSAPEIEFLSQRFCRQQPTTNIDGLSPSPIILEVGTGSGVVLAFVAAHAPSIFGREDVVALGTDVNEFACLATTVTVSRTFSETHSSGGTAAVRSISTVASLASVVCADLASPLRYGVADLLIFNPPYVPTPDVPDVPAEQSAENHGSRAQSTMNAYEYDSHLLSLSYAGGMNGMEVTTRLLQQLPNVLNSERGVAYILLCQQNKPSEIMQRINSWGRNWEVKVVGRSGKKAGWENLVVIRIWRTGSLI